MDLEKRSTSNLLIAAALANAGDEPRHPSTLPALASILAMRNLAASK
jgi:hypothetical protein